MTKMNNAVEQVRSKGRYGDTELMHVNPIEVEWMHKNLPGGLTRNPDTGQPEAFLPLLMAMAGSWGAGAMGLGTLMGTSALTAGAVGAGAGSFAGNMLQGESFGDSLKSGLTSGALSFGLGSLADASNAANAGVDVATNNANMAAEAGREAVNEGLKAGATPFTALDLGGATVADPSVAGYGMGDSASLVGANTPSAAQLNQYASVVDNFRPTLGQSYTSMSDGLTGGNAGKYLSDTAANMTPEGALALGAGAVGVGLGGLDSAMGPQYEVAEREKKQRGPWIEEQFPAERQRVTPGADYRPGIDPEFQFFSPVGRQRNVAGGGLMRGYEGGGEARPEDRLLNDESPEVTKDDLKMFQRIFTGPDGRHGLDEIEVNNAYANIIRNRTKWRDDPDDNEIRRSATNPAGRLGPLEDAAAIRQQQNLEYMQQRGFAGGGLMNIPRRGGMEGALRRFARGGLLRNFALGGAVRQRNLLPQGFQHGLNSEFNFFKPVTPAPGVGLLPSIPGHNPTVAPANMGLAPASTIHQITDDGQGGQLGPPGAPLGAEAANDPVGPVGVPGAMGPVGNPEKGPPAPANEFSVVNAINNNRMAVAAMPFGMLPVGFAAIAAAGEKSAAEKSAERAAQISKQATKEQPYKSEFNPLLSPPPLTAEETAEAAADAAASAAAASGGASGTDAPTGAPDMGHGDPDMGDEDSPDGPDGDPDGPDGDPSGGEGSGGGMD